MTQHSIWFGALKRAVSVLAAFLAAMGADRASSQTNRTIKIVITFPARSGGDILTRAMAEQITHTASIAD
jgi:tripartite-type tricarboxylate transporter receptor subunit TctC